MNVGFLVLGWFVLNKKKGEFLFFGSLALALWGGVFASFRGVGRVWLFF